MTNNNTEELQWVNDSLCNTPYSTPKPESKELLERIVKWLNCKTDTTDEAFESAFEIICECKTFIENINKEGK